MAMKCELCGKGPHYGNVVSHANNTRQAALESQLEAGARVGFGQSQADACMHGVHPRGQSQESRLSIHLFHHRNPLDRSACSERDRRRRPEAFSCDWLRLWRC